MSEKQKSGTVVRTVCDTCGKRGTDNRVGYSCTSCNNGVWIETKKDMTERTIRPFYGGFMSQWFTCDFEIDGVRYGCAEQFMMAEKARLFEDAVYEKLIMEAHHPHQQKALGKLVRRFNKSKWDAVARDIVYSGNYAKFKQNPGLEYELLDTKDEWLVEASPTDEIWGVGLDWTDEAVLDPENWQGTNWLGEVLMKVREDIIAGIETTDAREFNWT